MVKTMLFALFKKCTHYKISELCKLTSQPLSHLENILPQICLKERDGPNRNNWRLNDDFRRR